MPTMRYARHLSQPFLDQLSVGPLKFLVSDRNSWIPNDPFALDLQIREGDKLMYYHGTTALLTLRYQPQDGTLEVSASAAYAKATGYEQLIRRWPNDEQEHLEKLVPLYLASAVALARDGYYRNREEGYWQNRLCSAFGAEWKPGMDWLMIDREAVVGFGNDAEKKAVLEPIQQNYREVKSALQRGQPGTWGQPDDKGLGNESDFLALGPSGELYCIELKYGSNTSGIYWGSLQAAVYRDIFAAAQAEITGDIRTLVHQKVALGLLPLEAISRLPAGDFRGVYAVLLIAAPNVRSACWDLLSQVQARCPGGKTVVAEIRNYDDPAPVIRC